MIDPNDIVKAIVAVWKDNTPNGGPRSHEMHVACDTLDALCNSIDSQTDGKWGIQDKVAKELSDQFLEGGELQPLVKGDDLKVFELTEEQAKLILGHAVDAALNVGDDIKVITIDGVQVVIHRGPC